ncbi:MAG: hypothetical protein H7X93_13250, partial [Sphingomonadaceae bacterium]|nr:hypothetical protein [Sphingomonadaceae bacterium]
LQRGEALAERRCRDFTASGEFRLQSARVEPGEWICRPEGGGVNCAVDATAICALEQRELVETETCAGPTDRTPATG